MIQSGVRVRLATQFQDADGFVHPRGERGTVLWVNKNRNNHAAVEFEGYESERAADKKRWAEFGEGFNVVPWAAEIPIELLEETL